MATRDPLSPSSAATAYDAKAEEYDWRGPEVVFGLSYSFVNSGESVLDIGIDRKAAVGLGDSDRFGEIAGWHDGVDWGE